MLRIPLRAEEAYTMALPRAMAAASAFCRQVVESYTYEIVSPTVSSAALVPVDKTAIVLGKNLQVDQKGGVGQNVLFRRYTGEPNRPGYIFYIR
jgi:hypothetical protein